MDYPLHLLLYFRYQFLPPMNTPRCIHLYLIIANYYSHLSPFHHPSPQYNFTPPHSSFFFSSLALVTHFHLIHNRLCKWIGGIMTLEVTQLIIVPFLCTLPSYWSK